MNLGRYIHNLLPEHETVIIPGFGAFISTYKPAQINKNTSEITPPSKEISFEPKIRTNDGLLAAQIAEKEQISQVEALQKIEKEREEIIYRLDKGENITIEKTGVLFYDNNRKIRFEPSGDKNLLPDAFGLEQTSLKTEKKSIFEEKPADAEITKEKGSNADSRKTEPEEKTEPIIPETFFEKTEVPPKKKKRNRWWFLLILIPLIAAGIFIFRKEKKIQSPPVNIRVEPPPADNQMSEERALPPADLVEADSVAALVTDTVSTIENFSDSTGYVTRDTSKFYLVGGSFQKYENAEKYIRRIKNEGYDPFLLEKKGRYYIVGIGIFNTEKEAFLAQTEFLDKYPDSGAWIYGIE